MKFQGALSLCVAASTLVSANKISHLNRRSLQRPLKLKADSPIQQKWFTQISNHDDPEHPPAGVNKTFGQRYWIDTHYYKPGGPVIVLDGGETSGEDRIPFMETGIVRYLSEFTGGIGIVLEHRYYGESHVTQNLSTTNMQLLNTKQALADNAYFAHKLHKFLPKEFAHITPDNTPFISYGGSYAGSKSAFLQVAHPDAYYASIASSAVIWAGEDFWEYWEPQRQYGNRTCIRVVETVVDRFDALAKVGGKEMDDFMKLFGMNGLKYADAGALLTYPLGNWQSGNWDKTQPGANSWDKFCVTITNGVKLHEEKASSLGPGETTQGIRNYAAYMNNYVQKNCLNNNQTINQCYNSDNQDQYTSIALASDGSQDWRIWSWQVCTEYGYYQGGAPAGHPSLVSRLVDLDYNRKPCQYFFGFPKSHRTDTDKVNKYGSFNLRAPRLLYVDGDRDPWLYATAHSPYSPQRHRHDENSYIIPVAWHHSDENGLGDISKEPARIQKIHNHEINMVRKWTKQFYAEKGKKITN